MSKAKSLLQNLLLLGASGFVVLLGVEIFLRVTTPTEQGSPPEQGRGKASRFDATLGWANKERARARLETSEFTADVSINSRGLRGPEIPYERTPGRTRIALLGDSFAWGFGVSDDEMLSHRLGTELDGDVEVLNMGTVGYGTDQELLFYRTEGRRYEPDLVVLVFCSNDVANNASDRDRWYGKPRFVLEGDSVRLTNVPVTEDVSWDAWLTEYNPDRPPREGRVPWRRRIRTYGFLLERWAALQRRLEITRPGLFADGYPGSQESWRLTFRLIEALRREVEADGAGFVVVTVPRLEQMRFSSWIRPNVTLASFCAGAHIPFFDFLPSFRRAPDAESMFFPVDGHWNAAGHRFAAERLAEFLVSENHLPEPPIETEGAGGS